MSRSTEGILSVPFFECLKDIGFKNSLPNSSQTQESQDNSSGPIDVQEKILPDMEYNPVQLLQTLILETKRPDSSFTVEQTYKFYCAVYTGSPGEGLELLPSLRKGFMKTINHWVLRTGYPIWMSYPEFLKQTEILGGCLQRLTSDSMIDSEEENGTRTAEDKDRDEKVLKQFKDSLKEDWLVNSTKNLSTEKDEIIHKFLLLTAVEVSTTDNFDTREQMVQLCGWETPEKTQKIELIQSCLRYLDWDLDGIQDSPRMILLACLYEFIDKIDLKQEQDFGSFRDDFEKRYRNRCWCDPTLNQPKDSLNSIKEREFKKLLGFKSLRKHLEEKIEREIKSSCLGLNPFFRLDRWLHISIDLSPHPATIQTLSSQEI